MDELRAYLSNLHRPDRLDTPQIRSLLRSHGRFPSPTTPTAVGAAAAALFRDKIAALKQPADATWEQRLPHSVLEMCFARGFKNFQAAQELGISERQLSRERTRTLSLLAAELAPPTAAASADSIPSIEGHLDRGTLLRQLAQAVAEHRFVAVVGTPGAGKTSIVAALSRLVRTDQVWWLRIRPGLNDCLESFLIELGHVLAREGEARLLDYLLAALPRPNLGTATRLTLDAIAQMPRLIVLDDFHDAGKARPIRDFLEEAVVRTEQTSVVVIGRTVAGRAFVTVPPLSRAEVGQMMTARAGDSAGNAVGAIHSLTGGEVGLVAAAASWWSRRTRTEELVEQLTGRGALVTGRGLVALLNKDAA